MDKVKLVAGFRGKDAMREKAEKMLKGQGFTNNQKIANLKEGGRAMGSKSEMIDRDAMADLKKMKKGGMCTMKKMAAGGAAKVRKGMMTKEGKMIK